MLVVEIIINLSSNTQLHLKQDSSVDNHLPKILLFIYKWIYICFCNPFLTRTSKNNFNIQIAFIYKQLDYVAHLFINSGWRLSYSTQEGNTKSQWLEYLSHTKSWWLEYLCHSSIFKSVIVISLSLVYILNNIGSYQNLYLSFN